MNTKKILTQIKRELWENKIRFVYAPIIASLLLIAIMFIGVIKFNGSLNDGGMEFRGKITVDKQTFMGGGTSTENRIDVQTMLNLIDSEGSKTYDILVMGASAANTVILGVLFLFAMQAYALGCLFDDRKNKDILFWRSLPVSETTNVLVKLGYIVLYAPLAVFALNLIIVGVALVTATVFFMCYGAPLGSLVESMLHSRVFLIPLIALLYFLQSMILLLPVIGFLLLSSAWAKKSPFLIFITLPVGLLILDKIAQEWFSINLNVIDLFSAYGDMLESVSQNPFFKFVTNSHQSIMFFPDLTFGMLVSVAIGAAFVAGAIWLRNNRYEI